MYKKGSDIYYSQPNHILILIYIMLSIFGSIIFFDISANQVALKPIIKQIIWLFSGITYVFIILKFNLAFKIEEFLKKKYIYFLILLSYLLLFWVLNKGVVVNGAKRWINIFGISFQPSSLIMLILIIYYSEFLSRKIELIRSKKFSDVLKVFTIPLIVTGSIFFLIFREKHLSILLITSATIFTMIYIAGLRKRYFFSIIIIGLLGLSFILFGSSKKNYRNDRIDLWKKYNFFLRKYNGYDKINVSSIQVKESLIAITAGGFFGKGFSGGRSKYQFLPEVTSDYVFSVINEEFGYLAGILVIIGYMTILLFSIKAVEFHKSLYLKFLTIGISMLIFYTVLVNIGVATSILPSTGVPLPFLSYGGTAFWINSIEIGILANLTKKIKL
jgi:cell division protein FtsW (lipid II flippase)